MECSSEVATIELRLVPKPKVGFVGVNRQNRPHPEVVVSTPKSQGYFGQNKFVLLNLQKLPITRVFTTKNKRRCRSQIKLRLKVRNVRKPDIHSVQMFETIKEAVRSSHEVQ